MRVLNKIIIACIFLFSVSVYADCSGSWAECRGMFSARDPLIWVGNNAKLQPPGIILKSDGTPLCQPPLPIPGSDPSSLFLNGLLQWAVPTGGSGGSGPPPFYYTIQTPDLIAGYFTIPYSPPTPGNTSLDIVDGSACTYDFAGPGVNPLADFYVSGNQVIFTGKRLASQLQVGDQVRVTYFP